MPLAWLFSRYASGIDDISCFHIHFLQVLKGETPFHGLQDSAIGYHVLRGRRPEKPENAAAIGFSDSLWAFTERCWDGKMELRPEVGEVVERLEEAATSWFGLMAPLSRASDVDSSSEAYLDSAEPSEFNVPIIPRRYLSCNGTDLFVISEGFTESGSTAGPFSGPSTPPSQSTEPQLE